MLSLRRDTGGYVRNTGSRGAQQGTRGSRGRHPPSEMRARLPGKRRIKAAREPLFSPRFRAAGQKWCFGNADTYAWVTQGSPRPWPTPPLASPSTQPQPAPSGMAHGVRPTSVTPVRRLAPSAACLACACGRRVVRLRTSAQEPRGAVRMGARRSCIPPSMCACVGGAVRAAPRCVSHSTLSYVCAVSPVRSAPAGRKIFCDFMPQIANSLAIWR